ncbi:acetyl-CoA carboxylase biotin carboxyl carrier protein subunit [Xanthobacter sp. DSM 24535]|uniref:acetyl-CoA carboxylase biotin carboxyl carrier protein subunit n=1 Tax=Roseixanthobacter psychrophilus TaxID=3119917 RepID=UPI00372696AE
MDIKAEVAGAIFEILARVGMPVAKGDPVLVLESMKMEIVVPAPQDGEVAELLVSENDVVEAGQVLMRLKP